MAKPKNLSFVYGPGIAKMCWVNVPSQPFESKGDPQFKTSILLDDTVELRAKIDEQMKACVAEAKKLGIKLKKQYQTPFQFPEDQDEDDFLPAEGKDRPKFDEDYRGKIVFTTKSKYQPGMIDSARNSLPEDVKIMGGDIIKVKVENNPYEGFGSGISFRFKTIQLVDKNSSYSGHAPDTDGFEDIEDGYVADQTAGDDVDDDEIPF